MRVFCRAECHRNVRSVGYRSFRPTRSAGRSNTPVRYFLAKGGVVEGDFYEDAVRLANVNVLAYSPVNEG